MRRTSRLCKPLLGRCQGTRRSPVPAFDSGRFPRPSLFPPPRTRPDARALPLSLESGEVPLSLTASWHYRLIRFAGTATRNRPVCGIMVRLPPSRPAGKWVKPDARIRQGVRYRLGT